MLGALLTRQGGQRHVDHVSISTHSLATRRRRRHARRCTCHARRPPRARRNGVQRTNASPTTPSRDAEPRAQFSVVLFVWVGWDGCTTSIFSSLHRCRNRARFPFEPSAETSALRTVRTVAVRVEELIRRQCGRDQDTPTLSARSTMSSPGPSASPAGAKTSPFPGSAKKGRTTGDGDALMESLRKSVQDHGGGVLADGWRITIKERCNPESSDAVRKDPGPRFDAVRIASAILPPKGW
jgi:hypothetical protein